MTNELENLPPAGAMVVARDWHWLVLGHDRDEECALLRVQPYDDQAPRLGAFLLPFERCRPVRTSTRLRPSSRIRCARRLAALTPARDGALLPAAWAAFEVLPFQLAPAQAVLAGTSSRLLIADEVGLGKTIQAGLLLHALRQRGLGDRCLLLVPACLREQWRRELIDRFQIPAECVDAGVLSRRSSTIPAGHSSWRRPEAQIVSIDFARQLDVLAGLTEVCWDLLVIDEAHHVAGQTARAAAARALARRSRHLVLLSATPHAGDDRAFAALCDLGRLSQRRLDPLLWFRRTPGVLGTRPVRRSRTIRVRESAAEAALLDRLEQYAASVEREGSPEARLAMIVLRKRALSGPAALAASLARRLAALGDPITTSQMPLPLEGDDDADAGVAPVLAAAGPEIGEAEHDRLRSLISAAERAARGAAKLRWVQRFLGRAREPAVVFTEYRDTLTALAEGLASLRPAILHGGLDPSDRDRAIHRFTSGSTALLLATDAAGEGLNLQARCRLVVHFELPWSPVRLEQRTGRVDRIGQERRVHVWHLLGRHGAERRVLARLSARARAVRRALGSDATWLAPELTDRGPVAAPRDGPAGLTIEQAFEAEAANAARVLALLRRLLPGVDAGRAPAARGVPWARLRPRRARQLAPGVLFVFASRARALREDEIEVIHVALRTRPPRSNAALISDLQPMAEAAVAAAGSDRADVWRVRLVKRERALLAGLESSRQPAWQPGLFDRKAARAAAAAAERLDRQRREHQARLTRLSQHPTADPPRLIAVLVVE